MSEELICGSCGHPPHPKHGCPWPSNNAERIHCGCSADHSAYPTVQKQLADLRQRLAAAEASAAAVGAQVREDALRVAGHTYSEAALSGCDANGAQDCVLEALQALPLPSGAEALAARDRATAERAVLATLRHSRLGLYASALNPDATVPGFADEILSELFPASGRTTTEGRS